ncbi:MAG: hypothetical protein ABJO64_11265 [Nitratireductor sp.]
MSSNTNEKSIEQRGLLLFLQALDVRKNAEPIDSESIGSGAVLLPDQAVVLTLSERTVLTQMADLNWFAIEHSVDAVLVCCDEAGSRLLCHVILAALPGDPAVFRDMEIWLQEGELWLVDCQFHRSIRVTSEGLELVLGQPAATPGQWRSGLLRAKQSLLQKQTCEEVVR